MSLFKEISSLSGSDPRSDKVDHADIWALGQEALGLLDALIERRYCLDCLARDRIRDASLPQ